MKVLGISGSPRKNHNTDILVKKVLSSIDVETEFISLAGKHIGPCIACLRCVKDNICKVKDDMQQLRSKIIEADAYVIGAPNYYSMLNGLSHCFLERFYQFRHQEGNAIRGKLGIAIGIGGSSGEIVVENIKSFFEYNKIECVGTISAQGTANCYKCGFGESCKVGAVYTKFGPNTIITPTIIPSINKQQDKLIIAQKIGRRLNSRLSKK